MIVHDKKLMSINSFVNLQFIKQYPNFLFSKFIINFILSYSITFYMQQNKNYSLLKFKKYLTTNCLSLTQVEQFLSEITQTAKNI